MGSVFGENGRVRSSHSIEAHGTKNSNTCACDGVESPDLPIFQRLSILLITLLKFDLFVSMIRDNTVSGSGYRVCMVMTERLVDIFRFQV